MNPLTNIKSLTKLIDQEITLGRVGTKTSWHEQYRSSAWCFYGGMPFELTEGDIICIFSQFGEIVNLNLIRDRKTGKSKGFGFVCYEDQRSTDLSVDNFNGVKILDRMIRVDHVLNYKPPKDTDDIDEITRFMREEGVAANTLDEKKDLVKELMEKKQEDEKKSKAKQEYLKSKYGDVQKTRHSRDDDKYNRRDKGDYKRTENKYSDHKVSRHQHDDREKYRKSEYSKSGDYKSRRDSRSRSKSPVSRHSTHKSHHSSKNSSDSYYRKQRRSYSRSRSNSPVDQRKQNRDHHRKRDR